MIARNPSARRISPSVWIIPLGWATSIRLEKIEGEGLSISFHNVGPLIARCAALAVIVPRKNEFYARREAVRGKFSRPRLHLAIGPGLSLDYDFELDQAIIMELGWEALCLDFWELPAVASGLSALLDECREDLSRIRGQDHG